MRARGLFFVAFFSVEKFFLLFQKRKVILSEIKSNKHLKF